MKIDFFKKIVIISVLVSLAILSDLVSGMIFFQCLLVEKL